MKEDTADQQSVVAIGAGVGVEVIMIVGFGGNGGEERGEEGEEVEDR